MSSRIRGQEALLQIAITDDSLASFDLQGSLSGSFSKVRDLTITQRMDITEENYLNETFTDLDQQLHGYDLSFTIDETDQQALKFMSLVAFNEELHLPPPLVNITVTYFYRDGQGSQASELFQDCILKQNDRSIGGRTEYVQNAFEAKAKRRTLI
jgi:hypothetical protein